MMADPTYHELPVAIYLREIRPGIPADVFSEQRYCARTWPGREVVTYVDRASDADLDDWTDRPELERLCVDIAAGKVSDVVTSNFLPSPGLLEFTRRFRAAGLQVMHTLGDGVVSLDEEIARGERVRAEERQRREGRRSDG